MQRYLHELRLETHRTVTKRLKAGLVAGDLPAGTDIAAVASFYTTLIHGLSIQARDGASRASLMAAVDCAMGACDSLAGSWGSEATASGDNRVVESQLQRVRLVRLP